MPTNTFTMGLTLTAIAVASVVAVAAPDSPGGGEEEEQALPAKYTRTFRAEDLCLSGKKGIGFTLRDPESQGAREKGGTWTKNMPRVTALDVSWNYSWGMGLAPVQPTEIEFVPMAWGGHAAKREVLEERVVPLVESGRIKRFLGFNEPDNRKQANMPYMKAVDLWPALMDLDVPLCSPGCANTEGIDDETVQGVSGTWMRDFMREIDRRGYRVDYIGVHWYGGTNPLSFKAKMRRIYEKYGRRPLLITEFAPADWRAKSPGENRHTPARVLAFMKDALPWIEQQDWIAGYAWFPFAVDSRAGTASALFDRQGNLTACGRYYRSITPENPDGDQTIKPDPPHHGRE